MVYAGLERFRKVRAWLHEPVSNAPLVVFRILFGAMMLFSTLRFWGLGWIEDHYIRSKVQFKYFGFEWVELLPPAGMYALHIAMIVSTLGIMFGWFYRVSAVVFFFAFTYTELIDLTYYLNHYYFVSLVSLLLIFVPAQRRFSLDVWRDPAIFSNVTPRWAILIFQLQLGIVYVYAGLAKINYDWLVGALPLRIWVPANDALPVVGPLFQWQYTPWLFSWAGMLYDTTIVFWLIWPRTRAWAYLSVVVFHGLTGLMFQIGVFPLAMIGATWIFFSEKWHERLFVILTESVRSTGAFLLALPIVERAVVFNMTTEREANLEYSVEQTDSYRMTNIAHTKNGEQDKNSSFKIHHSSLIILFFAFQLLFPWRYLLYPGNLFWTEEGYRFSWRVMLMEKAGTATFFVKDKKTGREGVVNNGDFLCAHQEKQMAMQPDMVLQFAHFLKKHYEKQGVSDPAVRAEVYVTLNARPSRLLIDPQVDLTKIEDGWSHKTWILNENDNRVSKNDEQ